MKVQELRDIAINRPKPIGACEGEWKPDEGRS